MPDGLARNRRGHAVPAVGGVLRPRASLAPQAGTVLPLLSDAQIGKALQRLTPAEIDEALRHRVFPIAWSPDATGYAVAGPAAAAHARALDRVVMARADPVMLRRCLQATFDRRLKWQAEWGLAARAPLHSARRRLMPSQAMALLGFLVLPLLPTSLGSEATSLFAAAVFSLFFLMVIGLRLLSLWRPPYPPAPAPRRLADEELPVYTVLVPLFRETAILRQLLGALLRIDYPRHRLDIKIVLEESDVDMRRCLAGLRLPSHIESIAVPVFGPQTKPKALNYALALSRGELVAIFDAEDIPDPGQLKLAAMTFANAPPHLACLQARLEFYDPGRNWLTRQFTIEYACLYGLLLPALASLGLPMPLGGTSNHFRADILRRIGAWDPFNVTEDADLGLRLARAGYRAAVIDSLTEEEPNGNLRNWMNQRARWLKGWMQTWLVHMREPRRLHGELGAAGFWAVQALTGGIVVSALLHPLFLALTLRSLLSGSTFPAKPDGLTALFGGLAVSVLVLGYGISIAAGVRGLRRQGLRGWWPTLLSMPLYWLLISAAAWLALWQFAWRPFAWNKTKHGMNRRRRRSPWRRQRRGGKGSGRKEPNPRHAAWKFLAGQ